MPKISLDQENERFARLATVLQAGVMQHGAHDQEALRALRHRLRLFNTNKARSLLHRSEAAHSLIVASEQVNGAPLLKNGSGNALASDHIHSLTMAMFGDTAGA
jgi:hypothetical protein